MQSDLIRNVQKRLLESKLYDNKEDVELVLKDQRYKLNEDQSFIPRFKVNQKYHQIFSEFPINKQLKYSHNLLQKAIQYGMILLVQYRGKEDQFVQGHTRVLYPMVLGKSGKNAELLRGYHLKGWSVSAGGNVDKVWRMFRTDRILSFSFTGSFFRLPPAGYNMRDRGMKGGVQIAADFNRIRRNQQQLMKKDIIQYKQEVEFDKINAVYLDNTNTVLNLKSPYDNPNLDVKQKDIIRMSFLKKTTDNTRIAILGALGKRDNVVKVYAEHKYLGTFKVERSFMGPLLDQPVTRNINGVSEFPLYIFLNKK